MKNKVMISGYYGFGNIGDEAILESIIDSIRDVRPETEFVVLSSNIEKTESELNVTAINRMNVFSIILKLFSTNLFISGGGGLMQDVTGPISVIYYGFLLKIAQMLNVYTMVYAQGIGPIKKAYNKKLLKHFFKNTSAITVRETFSQKDLISYGLPIEKIQVTADPVLLMKTSVEDLKYIQLLLKDLGFDLNKPIIGVSIRPWKSWYERQFKAFTSILFQVAKKYDSQILLIPFQMSSDLWLCKEAEVCFNARPESDVKIRVLERDLNSKQMLSLIASMKLIIGMRLHSLIMATVSNIPSVGISYDPKVENFCKLAGYPYIASVTDLQDVDTLLMTIESVLSDFDNNKNKLIENLPKLRELSFNNVKTALKFLG